MFEHVVSSGCSFTWGDELTDANSRYTKVLARRLSNSNLTCFAKIGVSNEVISQNIINGLISLKNKCTQDNTLVIVQWTFASRLNYYGRKHGYYTITDYNMTPTMRKKKIMAGHANAFFDDNFDDLYTVKSYYDYHTNPDYMCYNLVKLVHHTQSFLVSKGYRYVFVFASNKEKEVFDLDSSSFQHMHKFMFEKDCIPPYYFMLEEIDKTNIFPTCFTNYAYDNKFSFGPHLHPLEDAHVSYGKLLAEYIKDKFNV